VISATVFGNLVAVLTQTDAQVVLGLLIAIPATISAFAGYQSAMARREARKQMERNGGSSLRDALDRIEKRLTALEDFITDPKEG
jgi:hypothetical protein